MTGTTKETFGALVSKFLKVLLVSILVMFGALPLLVAIKNSLDPSAGTVATIPIEAPLPTEAATPVQAVSSKPTNDQAIAEYKARLNTIPGFSNFVSDIRPGLIDGMVELDVTVNFQEESKPAREDFAVSLWETWATASGVKDVDDARIRLVTRQGKEVGGSRMIGGSVIYVVD